MLKKYILKMLKRTEREREKKPAYFGYCQGMPIVGKSFSPVIQTPWTDNVETPHLSKPVNSIEKESKREDEDSYEDNWYRVETSDSIYIIKVY